MKNKIVLLTLAAMIGMSVNASAEVMAHWAVMRDITGTVIGYLNEGEYVTVNGYDASSGRIWVTTSSGVVGNVAAVYIYGGTEYQYENPVYYYFDYSNLPVYDYSDYLTDYTYDGMYGEYNSYDYSYDGTYENTYEYSYDYSYDYSTYDDSYNYSYETTLYSNDFSASYESYEPTYGYEPYYQAVQPVPEVTTKYENVWVDVDLSEQIISVNSGTENIFSTYCVTGTFNKTDTPVGDHYILSKEMDAILRGDTYEVGVSYWMPFTASGCGIHDATWRYDFSRDAYINNGSHGCVNVIYDTARQIFDLVDVGTLVRVHE